MSDPASPVQADGVARGDRPAPLTPARIDAILADFRRWLEALASERGSDEVASRAEPIDLFTLVGQFTALRHEVNLQTKATRAATEHASEVMKQLEAPNPDDAIRPFVKVLIDLADALLLAMKQVEKAQAVAEESLGAQASELSSPRRGLFARLLGKPEKSSEQPTEAVEKLRRLLAGVADGYALSLRRIERLLPEYGVEPFGCVGGPFDPESMEVLEAVAAPELASGTVTEEVRRGYLWNGKLFRFALVKVAR
jgi:molecular chaperone GrpE